MIHQHVASVKHTVRAENLNKQSAVTMVTYTAKIFRRIDKMKCFAHVYICITYSDIRSKFIIRNIKNAISDYPVLASY